MTGQQSSDSIRELIGFPPFPPEHLGNSLAHLAELVTCMSSPHSPLAHSLIPGLDPPEEAPSTAPHAG